MRNFIKRFSGRIAAVALILIVALLPLSGCSNSYKRGSKQTMEKLDIAAQLNSGGDMQVTEIWRVSLENRGKEYRNLYKTFPMDLKQSDGIVNLSVYDIDNHVQYAFRNDIDPTSDSYFVENVCYIYDTSTETEIGWFMPPIASGVRNFKVSYTVKNLVSVYKDTSVLYTAFVGKNFSLPITELHGTVSFPSGAKKTDLRAWLHCTAASNLTIDSPNKISFTASQIPANTMVETRVCMPVSLFPNSKKVVASNAFNNIVKEEQKWAEDWTKKQKNEFLVGIIDASAGAFLLFLGIFLLILIKNKEKPHKVDAPEYTREIPEGSSPGGAANLFYFYSGGVTDRVQGRVFSATLMSLARKGYVRFDANQHKNFVVTVIGNTKKVPLTLSEQTFFDLISTVASDFNNQFTMRQFESYAKEHNKYVDSSIQEFLSQAKREIAARDYYEHRPGFLAACAAMGVVSIVAAIFTLVYTKGWLLYFPLGLIALGVFLIIASNTKTRLSIKGEYDYAVWQGLRKYMLEFSRMNEYGVPELALWEEYLVYATMMGISKKVCEQLKMVYPQLNDDSYIDTNFSGSYMYFMFGRHMGMGGFSHIGNDFGSVLGTTISNISTSATRLAHPPVSSDGNRGGFGGGGFGGGGFGGGGGGFGAGGGGGVR